ncbi:uncharacterized protein LOC133186979 [Saccostrea echinata]|uniref:uncharacterized protein LOC133186979 n=1 Tax=Saccostrea echinata TaxID=191078 RepID=UPI002A841294|nr:uncharacterized protein LOC133186979 [Saccostrea echinata]
MIKDLCFFLICFIVWDETYSQTNESPTDLAVVEAPVEEKNPKNIDIGLNIGNKNKNLELHLERYDELNANAFVLVPRVTSDGKSVLVRDEVPADSSVAFYHDPKNGGAFLMKCDQQQANGECTKTLQGSVYIEGEEYAMQPLNEGARRKRQVDIKVDKNGKRKTRVMYGLFKKTKPNKNSGNWELNKKNRNFKKVWEKVKKEKTRKPERGKFGRPAVGRNRLSRLDWARTSNKGVPVFTPAPVEKSTPKPERVQPLQAFRALGSRTKRRLVVDINSAPVLGERLANSAKPTAFATASKRTVVTTVVDEYNVGILVGLDYATYERFYKKSTGATSKERDINTKKEMRLYFSQVINGVALRYKTIKGDFSLNIVVTGFIIVDVADYPCFTCGKVRNPFDDTQRQLTNIESALTNITEFRRKTTLPNHDHLMLFTDLDLYFSPSKNNYQTDVTGFAYVGALCTEASTSVIEDFGNFESVFTAAHELGHSLGAQHDGVGNDCAEMDQYLLTAVSGQTTETTKHNPWKFSSCSIDYFREYIANISKPDSRVGNCLTDEALIYDTKEFNQNIATHPGQLTNPNDQCKAIVGPNSYYGWGNVLKSFADICTSMACNTGENADSFVFGTAFRGTSCGDKKWCLEGRCVSDTNAPSKNPNCVHGDSIGTFSFLEKTCAQVVTETPSQCYKDIYKTRCCESCEKAADKLKPECPFGDRGDSCSKILSNPSLCYVEERDCCDTCDKVNTGPEGCEYGDKIDTCVPEDCGTDEAYRDQCCDTCADYVPPVSTTPPVTEPSTTTEATTTQPPPPTTAKPTSPPPTTTQSPPTTTTKQTTQAPTPSPIKQTTTQAPTPSPTEPTTTQPTTTASKPLPKTTTAVPTTTATVSPYQHLCVNPSLKFGFRSCTEVGQQLYIPCHNDMFRRLCCKECGACSDRQDRKCWDVQKNPGQCFYKNVKEDCCETCTKIAEKGCVEDASQFCEYFVKENPIYVCENYRPVCCKSCKPYPVNALFARSAKGNTQLTKTQIQIDSVLKKASDPNTVVDLNKDHLKDIPEAKQLEKAGIKDRPKKPERKKFQSRRFLNLKRTSGNTRRPANTRTRGTANTRRLRLNQRTARPRLRSPRRNNRNNRRISMRG